MAVEYFIPLRTILAVGTNLVIKTAHAAKDVVVEKSFKVLSEHLFEIGRILKDLQLQELNESQATRQALHSLMVDFRKVNNLVEKYRNRARFYMLLKCQHIVKEVQDVTRDIGKSLLSFSLLINTEVLSRVADQVIRLHNEMQTPHSHLQIVDKLDRGIRDLNWDQAFADDVVGKIAMAVGVPVEPSEISKELANLKKEKEEAANNKERAEALFLEQVIELLSRADAARDYEEAKKLYEQRVQALERYNSREGYIQPLTSFLCPINRMVMADPASLCTGTTCERAAITAWLESGNIIDPHTREVLEDTSLWPNNALRKSIEEWRELNYCLKIRSSKVKLLSGVDTSIEKALNQMQDLMRESSINKDWICVEGLTEIIVTILRNSQKKDVKRKILLTLKDLVEVHTRNKEELIEFQGWGLIIRLLGEDPIISKAAIELLYELLQDRFGWNVCACKKLSQRSTAIPFLVTLLNSPVQETAEIAEKIWLKLLEIDEENISRAAKSRWYKLLVGPESSRISMVRTVVNMELIDSNLELLGEEGIIPSLIVMASAGNIESKELALSALVKLSGCRANKKLIAEAGGVDFVINLMSTPLVRRIIVVKCCEILEKLSSDDDSINYFVDERGTQLELGSIVTNLLALLQNPNSVRNVRRWVMCALLGICKFEAGLVKKAVLTINGVSPVLSLLDIADLETCEVAIKLLFLFSKHEPEGVVEYLLRPRRLEVLVGFLKNRDKEDIKRAATGLLANLPKSEKSLTKKLIELNGHTALVDILKTGPMDIRKIRKRKNTGTMKTKENALSALFRFTDPENIELQRSLVEAGVYPLLVNLLKASSVPAKARAAALIGSLSTNTPKLTVESKSAFNRCFKPSSTPLCSAHGGICGVTSSFCLLEANALPDLVKLLHGEVHETAFEAVQTLSTLVNEASPHKGASVLHDANAIKPILDILRWGPIHLKEKALGLLEKVFVYEEMVEKYGTSARFLLLGLTDGNIHPDGSLAGKAAKILSLLEYSRSLSSLLPVRHG
ncbi:Coatomer beta subunit [Parasponia andersonii]|uniref:RING-type E3 ubiquitin transferase n=1 Tax=Parasponia andersonii TaxID=3476 RepID=A0A2P5AUF2_PARAD|nr:Coatomer beta subunit [Parasponia andersonii]